MDLTRHVEHSTLSQSSVSRPEKRQGRDASGVGFQREHLYMALSNRYVVAMPCNRALDDLPVNAGVAAELVALGPLFKVEEVAEKLKGVGLVE